jgi:tRNA pseudouridine38-40 synthase
VDAYTGNDLLYLNPKGIIPAAAVITPGERRANPFKERKRFDATSFSMGKAATSKPLDEEDEDDVPLDKARLAETEG